MHGVSCTSRTEYAPLLTTRIVVLSTSSSLGVPDNYPKVQFELECIVDVVQLATIDRQYYLVPQAAEAKASPMTGV